MNCAWEVQRTHLTLGVVLKLMTRYECPLWPHQRRICRSDMDGLAASRAVDWQLVAEVMWFATDGCLCLNPGDSGVPSRHRPLAGWAGLRPRSPGHPLLLRRFFLLLSLLTSDTQHMQSFTVVGMSFPWLWWNFRDTNKSRLHVYLIYLWSVCVCVNFMFSSTLSMPWLNLQLIINDVICVTSQFVWVVHLQICI